MSPGTSSSAGISLRGHAGRRQQHIDENVVELQQEAREGPPTTGPGAGGWVRAIQKALARLLRG